MPFKVLQGRPHQQQASIRGRILFIQPCGASFQGGAPKSPGAASLHSTIQRLAKNRYCFCRSTIVRNVIWLQCLILSTCALTAAHLDDPHTALGKSYCRSDFVIQPTIATLTSCMACAWRDAWEGILIGGGIFEAPEMLTGLKAPSPQ